MTKCGHTRRPGKLFEADEGKADFVTRGVRVSENSAGASRCWIRSHVSFLRGVQANTDRAIQRGQEQVRQLIVYLLNKASIPACLSRMLIHGFNLEARRVDLDPMVLCVHGDCLDAEEHADSAEHGHCREREATPPRSTCALVE